jgi:hypothetical protein
MQRQICGLLPPLVKFFTDWLSIFILIGSVTLRNSSKNKSSELSSPI